MYQPRQCSSLVNIVSDYGLHNRGSIPGRDKEFFFLSGAHPASYAMGTEGSFPAGKARPGLDADPSLPSSAKVKNE
jgi:hypothetical protein